MTELFSVRNLQRALILFLSSWAVVQAGVLLGQAFVPPGDGLTEARALTERDLFRFDSVYYLKIAEDGYRYSGDPGSSPNLVFAPMFPLLVWAISFLPVDPILGGLILNKALLFFALVLLLVFLEEMVSSRRAFWSLFAMVTTAGTYAFHAFYSEATMLFFLGLALVCYQRRRRWSLAFAALALGASRLTAAPISAGFALLFLRAAWLNRHSRSLLARDLACALVSVLGVSVYLGWIWFQFGNPFVLLPEIQGASWGRFHPPTDVVKLASFGYLYEYWSAAIARGWSWLDIRTLNLLWTTLGVAAAGYLLAAWRRGIFAFTFFSYFLFIYCTNSSSEFLISAHRFFAPMLPIFLMFAAGVGKIQNTVAMRAVAAILLAVNLALGIFHAAMFNQGVWFFF